jgi:hypothetical protein
MLRRALIRAHALMHSSHPLAISASFPPCSILDCIALYYALMTSDNCNTVCAQLEGEVWEDYCSTLITGVRLPRQAKQLVAFMLRNALNDQKAATMAVASRERSVAEVRLLEQSRCHCHTLTAPMGEPLLLHPASLTHPLFVSVSSFALLPLPYL